MRERKWREIEEMEEKKDIERVRKWSSRERMMKWRARGNGKRVIHYLV